jgi:hypothetical protein
MLNFCDDISHRAGDVDPKGGRAGSTISPLGSRRLRPSGDLPSTAFLQTAVPFRKVGNRFTRLSVTKFEPTLMPPGARMLSIALEPKWCIGTRQPKT